MNSFLDSFNLYFFCFSLTLKNDIDISSSINQDLKFDLKRNACRSKHSKVPKPDIQLLEPFNYRKSLHSMFGPDTKPCLENQVQ
jgi:hypothetical protein